MRLPDIYYHELLVVSKVNNRWITDESRGYIFLGSKYSFQCHCSWIHKLLQAMFQYNDIVDKSIDLSINRTERINPFIMIQRIIVVNGRPNDVLLYRPAVGSKPVSFSFSSYINSCDLNICIENIKLHTFRNLNSAF